MPRVKVDHNGSCGEYNYEQGKPVDLPQEVIDALGEHAVLIDEQGNPKVQQSQEQTQKEAQPEEDKMIKSAETVTK